MQKRHADCAEKVIEITENTLSTDKRVYDFAGKG